MARLEHDCVHIWHTTLDHHSQHYPVFYRWLPVAEKVRADKLSPPCRQRFVLTRGLLRRLLSDYSPQAPETIHFFYTPSSSKPLWFNPSLHHQHIEFNVSHSQNRVAFALTPNTPLGIDLELKTPRKYIERTAYRFLPADDYERIKQSSGQKKLDVFFDAWVSNEALIKAGGYSLKTHPLSKYRLHAKGKLIMAPIQQQRYSLSSLTLHPDFAAALAVKGYPKTTIIRPYD